MLQNLHFVTEKKITDDRNSHSLSSLSRSQWLGSRTGAESSLLFFHLAMLFCFLDRCTASERQPSSKWESPPPTPTGSIYSDSRNFGSQLVKPLRSANDLQQQDNCRLSQTCLLFFPLSFNSIHVLLLSKFRNYDFMWHSLKNPEQCCDRYYHVQLFYSLHVSPQKPILDRPCALCASRSWR